MKTVSSLLFRIVLTLIAVCCFPLISHAQLRIGVIMSGDIPYYSAMHEAFIEELNKSTPPGQEIEIILQRPFPDPIAWSNAARKLIAFDVNLIVTYGSPATLAVINEKSRIPLVYAGVYDPASSAVDGKNITGCGYKVPLSSLLRYLKRLKKTDTLQIFFSSVEEDTVRQATEMVVLAEQQSLQANKIDIRSRGDLDTLNSFKEGDAVFLTGSSLAHLWLKEIMSTVREAKVPSSDIFPDVTEEGVLITLYQPAYEQGRKAADMAMRILGGEKPDTIQPNVFRDTELVFNLNAAEEINISFPVQLIIEATRVIK